jgi:hypothetical protein
LVSAVGVGANRIATRRAQLDAASHVVDMRKNRRPFEPCFSVRRPFGNSYARLRSTVGAHHRKAIAASDLAQFGLETRFQTTSPLRIVRLLPMPSDRFIVLSRSLPLTGLCRFGEWSRNGKKGSAMNSKVINFSVLPIILSLEDGDDFVTVQVCLDASRSSTSYFSGGGYES